MMAFLKEIDPRRVISFHQPLHGVDTDTKDAGFARRLARALRLPRTTLDCGGLCHGTMTMWFNHRFDGSALTVEYGARPPRSRMVRPGAAPRCSTCWAPTAPRRHRCGAHFVHAR